MKLIILSSAIHAGYGIQDKSAISLEHAQHLARRANEIQSFVGHEGTAKYISQLLGVQVPTNRAQYSPEKGDIVLAVTAKERLPEGAILSAEEMEGKFEIVRLSHLGIYSELMDQTHNLERQLNSALFHVNELIKSIADIKNVPVDDAAKKYAAIQSALKFLESVKEK